MQHPLFMAMARASTRLVHGFTLHIAPQLPKGLTHRKVPRTHSTDYPRFYALAAQAAPTTRWECDIAREVKNANVNAKV